MADLAGFLDAEAVEEGLRLVVGLCQLWSMSAEVERP